MQVPNPSMVWCRPAEEVSIVTVWRAGLQATARTALKITGKRNRAMTELGFTPALKQIRFYHETSGAAVR